jgi:transcription elongation factor GreA-like protein
MTTQEVYMLVYQKLTPKFQIWENDAHSLKGTVLASYIIITRVGLFIQLALKVRTNECEKLIKEMRSLTREKSN